MYAVLPIGPPSGYGIDDLRRAHLLIRSLRHFFDASEILEIFVVTPDRFLAPVRDALAELSGGHVLLSFRAESEIVPQVKIWPVTGWVVQQFIKMAFPAYCDGSFWLTLDSDVIAVRPFKTSDLIAHGRALYGTYRDDDPLWRTWIETSAKLLGLEPALDMPTLGPTPNIYARPLMLDVQQRLESRSGRSWMDTLLDPSVAGKSTEMQLYHAAATDSGTLAQFHLISGVDVLRYLHRFEGGIWQAGQVETWDPAVAFGPNALPYYFIVCNSYTGISAERVENAILPYLR